MTAVADDAVRFPIRIGPRSRPVARLFGATPGTAYAELGDDLTIRFGRFGFRTPVSNLQRYRIEGPFTWIKAIGVRMSIRHHDVSFCGSAHGAVRIDLKDPVRWGLFRAPAVWAGADDLDALAGELSRRGIPGADARRRTA
ncbi:MAG TPA: hypothetical protein VFV72_06705 [Candidatus Limnocylindrales bacterium]|nr:hypothetical protein [Candidatus Limnocylindrales bacterium]